MIEPEALFSRFSAIKIWKNIFTMPNFDLQDIRSALLWTRSLGKVRIGNGRPRKITHTVMNKAWTARTTLSLISSAYDMTDHARSGLTGYVVNRRRGAG